MKNKLLTVTAFLFVCSGSLYSQELLPKVADTCNAAKGTVCHPWLGKKVGYLGDSITDPNNYGDEIRKYWDFLKEWLDITPYVYGVSGRQWNDLPNQAERLKKEHGGEVDAILVFLGTNDFNHGVEELLVYFHDSGFDRLHPSTKGHERMARTLMYQLLALPVAM